MGSATRTVGELEDEAATPEDQAARDAADDAREDRDAPG
jgi:hypothetical protein